MNAINKVDKSLSQSIGNAGILAGGAKNYADSSAESIRDNVYLASKVGPRRIANIYDSVRFSALIPQPISASDMQNADEMAEKITNREIIKPKEEDNLREDKVFAALVGMRIMQRNSGELKEMWIGGLDRPTDEEIAAAYKRLTQRVGQPSEVDDQDYIHQMRLDLLNYFRDYPENAASEDEDGLEQMAA